MRCKPQRSLVACGGRIEIATNHVGVAEIGMKFGDGLDRHLVGRSRGYVEPGLISGDGLADPASAVMVTSEENEFFQRAGGGRCGRYGGGDHETTALDLMGTARRCLIQVNKTLPATWPLTIVAGKPH